MDREKIRKEYETTDIKPKALAEKHGLSVNTLKSWMKRDGWRKEGAPTEAKGAPSVVEKVHPARSAPAPPSEAISWLDIETEYVTDVRRKPVTLQALSKKYGVPLQTIKEHAAKHKWTEKRDKHRTRVLQETMEKSADLISDDAAQFIARHIRITDQLLGLVEKALANPREPYLYVEKLKEDFVEHLVCEKKEAVNTGRLLQMMSIAEKAQKLQRQSLGILDPAFEAKLDLEMYKLLPKDEGEETEDDGFIDALRHEAAEGGVFDE